MSIALIHSRTVETCTNNTIFYLCNGNYLLSVQVSLHSHDFEKYQALTYLLFFILCQNILWKLTKPEIS